MQQESSEFSDDSTPTATDDDDDDLTVGRILFSAENVAIWPTPSEQIPGRFTLISQNEAIYLAWIPYHTNTSSSTAKDLALYAVQPIPVLSSVQAVKRHISPLRPHTLTFILQDGVSLAPFHFQQGAIKSLFCALREHVNLLRSYDDPSVYLIRLSGIENSMHASVAAIQAEDPDSMKDHINELLETFQRAAQDTVASFFGTLQSEDADRKTLNPPTLTPLEGVETDLGTFELIEESQEQRSKASPLTRMEVESVYMSAQGVLTPKKFLALKERIFCAGCHPNSRPEVWKFLLGLYPVDSTREERVVLLEEKKEAYIHLRAQWQNMTGAQLARFSKFRERKSRIEKDVRRTDRTQPLFIREKGQGQRMLRRILLTHVMYNQDVGYVQGFSDLCSPILAIMKSDSSKDSLQVESEAFWCFAYLMEGRMAVHFNADSIAMHRQLLELRDLVRKLDPSLHSALESAGCQDYFFCYRWLLILFKREFPFGSIQRLWEAIFSCPDRKKLHLYIGLALLQKVRKELMSDVRGPDDAFRICLGVAGREDVENILKDATALAALNQMSSARE